MTQDTQVITIITFSDPAPDLALTRLSPCLVLMQKTYVSQVSVITVGTGPRALFQDYCNLTGHSEEVDFSPLSHQFYSSKSKISSRSVAALTFHAVTNKFCKITQFLMFKFSVAVVISLHLC